jgi:hypothetical protein
LVYVAEVPPALTVQVIGVPPPPCCVTWQPVMMAPAGAVSVTVTWVFTRKLACSWLKLFGEQFVTTGIVIGCAVNPFPVVPENRSVADVPAVKVVDSLQTWVSTVGFP